MKKQQHKNKQHNTKPIKTKEEVANHPDPRIDQDFPGFPHPPSQEKIITPQNGEDKATANLNGENTNNKKNKDHTLREEPDNSSKKKSRQ